jgi:carbon starvation protein
VGFLSQARALAAGPATGATGRLIFNNRLDAAVTGVLVVMVTLVLAESGRQWWGILRGTRAAPVKEAPFVRTRLVEERG